MACKTASSPVVTSSVVVSPPKKGKMESRTQLATTSEECVVLIKDIVKTNKKQIKFCYDNELRDNPTLEGKMVLEFAITAGVVEKFVISKNETGSKTLEICVEKTVTKWEFPSQCSEDLARLPFTFFPE